MSEETRAQYYQTHKDDEDEWGEPERPASAKRRLASMISVRFSPDEAKMIRRAAESIDESVSQYVRKATLQRCQRQRHLVSSISGTTQEIYRLQLASSSTTWTDGGPEASEGSHWTPNQILVGSTTA